jgi:Spy/CpxP family protein refolding chaperone
MRKLAMLLALAGWWPGATTADAADQPTAPAPQGEVATKLQEIAERLELTEEQKTQIAPILQKEIADLKVLRDDTSMRRGQKARRLQEISDTAGGQIRALLTPEQQEEYDKLRDEMREKLKARLKERQSAGN